MKHLAYCFAATIVCYLLTTQYSLAEPTNFGRGVALVHYAKPKLMREQYKNFAKWKKSKNYFGVFAISELEDVSSGSWKFHNLANAREWALQKCKSKTKSLKSCVVIAAFLPTSIPNTTQNAKGLSRPAAKDFEGVYKDKMKAGSYGAFAVNGLIHYGVAWDQASARDARQKAAWYCSASVTSWLKRQPAETQREMFRSGLLDCTVVHVMKGE